MLSLSMTRDSLKNKEEWKNRNIVLPSFDIDKVKKVLADLLDKEDCVVHKKDKQIFVSELGTSSIEMGFMRYPPSSTSGPRSRPWPS